MAIPATGLNHAEPTQPGTDSQLVIVRPHVVDTVGHVLGNLFQRIYHLIDEVRESERGRESEPQAVVELADNTRQLEDFLRLVLDYFSPLSLALQYLEGIEIAQSLAHQLAGAGGCQVKIDAPAGFNGRILADPGLLSRGFALLAAQVCGSPQANEGIELRVTEGLPTSSMIFAVRIPGQLIGRRSSQAEMRLAVAEKFLEVHGGSIQQKSTPTGEILWEIVLPSQS